LRSTIKYNLFLILSILGFAGISLFAAQPVAAATVKTSTTSNQTGSVQTVSIGLDSGEIYRLDLTSYKYTSYVINWNSSKTIYSSDDGISFQPVVHGICNEELNQHTSPLIVNSGQKAVYIKNSAAQTITVQFLQSGSSAMGSEGSTSKSQQLTPQAAAAATPGYINKTGGASYTELEMVNRIEWGADTNLTTWPPRYDAPYRFMIHHTATSTNYADFKAAVRDIFLLHSIGRGWGDIGYNYLIDPNGVIYEGRQGGEGSIGAHTGGYNNGGIGIAFIGDYSNGLPSAAALESMRQLILERALIHGITLQWGSTVYGHRDFNNTACPGQTLYNSLPAQIATIETSRQQQVGTSRLSQVRQEVQTLLSGYQDIRLQLQLSTTYADAAALRAALPGNYGINVMSVSGNQAVINIQTTKYNGSTYVDSSLPMQKLLLQFLILNNQVTSGAKLENVALMSSLPSGYLANKPKITFTASRPFDTLESTGVELRRTSDDALIARVDSSTTSQWRKISPRSLELTPNVTLPAGEYYLAYCGSCVKADNGAFLTAVTKASNVKYTVIAPKSKVNYIPDNKSDMVLYWPQYSTFYITNGTGPTQALAYGWNGVQPIVLDDFDGDGLADIAVWHRQTSDWYVRSSITGATTKYQFGWSAVTPVPADYDGDGKTDLAVYYPAGATWYVRQSSNNQTIALVWGEKYDTPITRGDFDADGKADFVTYSPKESLWRIRYSSNGQSSFIAYGWSVNTRPIIADFDGDGVSDLGIYDIASSTWHYRESYSRTDRVKQFGWHGVVPVWGVDYDGDGKSEIAVYDPGTGNWYIAESSKGYANPPRFKQFGWSAVRPLF
jgi:hypothetical protein